MIAPLIIKEYYIRKLKEKFEYPCYEFGVVEGMRLPCIFVRITGSGEINTKNTYSHEYTVETVIMYGKTEKNVEVQALKDVETIKEVVMTHLDVKGRKLPVSNFEFNYTGERGNIPRITFDLDFFDSLYKEEDVETMEIVKIKEELKHGNAEY